MIELVLHWIKTHSPSGVLNWENGKPYPEVSGYLIPTLLKYGEDKLARQYADWLLTIQHADGSFDGIDGIPRIFDTGACIEGLYAIGEIEAADKGKKWLQSQYLISGALPISPGDNHTHIYTARVSGIIDSKEGKEYWQFDGSWDERWIDRSGRQRVHYIAYGLEGLHILGIDISKPLEASQGVISLGTMPFYVSRDWTDAGGADYSATCQMAILYKHYGMKYKHLVEAVERYIFEQQSPVLSWCGKFYLDVKHD